MLGRNLIQAAAGNVSAAGWDLSNATFGGASNTLVPSANKILGQLFLKDDGTKLFGIESGADSVAEYDLSTAWAAGSASYSQSFDVSAQSGSPQGLFFKSDGLTFYITDFGNYSIFQYTLSTAWDVSTASYASKSFTDSTRFANVRGLHFKSDGTRVYVVDSGGDTIYQYNLSTAWDISTASYSNTSAYIGATNNAPRQIWFKPDGTEMYTTKRASAGRVYQHTLSTAWDITSISANTDNGFNISTIESVAIKSDGTKYMITKGTSTSLNYVTYDMYTAWDITSTYSLAATPGVYKPENMGNIASLFMDSSGTRAYSVEWSGDRVVQLSLSTAFNFGTASYVRDFSISSQESTPRSVFFEDDGTTMYVAGATDDVHQYGLSTAWDISTASYTRQFSPTQVTGDLNSVFFKDDGTKMYLSDRNNDKIYQYSLSTAWNVGTASYDSKELDVAANGDNSTAMFIRSDGEVLFVTSYIGDKVWKYTLSTAWDISTATYSQQYDLAAEAAYPAGVWGMWFNTNGTKMFLTGYSSDSIWEYDL
jgi:6-phosphogluconolactonase (cycloisomerase 2 family)